MNLKQISLLLLTVACALSSIASKTANNPSAKELLKSKKNTITDLLNEQKAGKSFLYYSLIFDRQQQRQVEVYVAETYLPDVFKLSVLEKGLDNICECMEQANGNNSTTLLSCHKSMQSKLKTDTENLKTSTLKVMYSFARHESFSEGLWDCLGYQSERLAKINKQNEAHIDSLREDALSAIEKTVNAIVAKIQRDKCNRKFEKIERSMPEYL